MELQSAEDVLKLKHIAAFKRDIEYAQCVSPLFSFKSQNKLHSNELKEDISIYSNFKAPKPNEIRKVLEQIDSVMY